MLHFIASAPIELMMNTEKTMIVPFVTVQLEDSNRQPVYFLFVQDGLRD